MIPEGWRVGRLDELGDIVGGATPSKAEDSYYTSKGIAWLTPKDLSNKLSKFTSRGEIDLTQEGYNSCSAKLMPKGSVLFSSRAPIGYLTIAKNDICTNQGFKSVVPKYAGTAYIYYLLKTNTKRIESMSSGTTFKEASGSLMKSLAVIIPPKSIIDNYEASVVEIFKEQEVIEDESTRLSTLRDTLLPKLMSGQIKV
jgi:type I restriction enzyme S subunit